jgi:choline-sulfatase
VQFPPPHENEQEDREGILRARQNYAAMIENIDRHVGRYIDLVRDRGELDNTLIIYSSDHGEMLGDHNRWGKSTWYDPSVRIPFVVAGPGVRQGVVTDALVSLHDLAPTFVEYAQAKPMPDMDARSLKPILEGKESTIREVMTVGLKDWRMAFDGRYKMVRWEGGEAVLYDLENDPLEDTDIAEREPDLVERLKERLPEWTDSTK